MLLRFTIIVIIAQIIVGLFYSTHSLRLNQQFTKLTQNKAQLDLSIETQELKLSQLSSLDFLKTATPSADLIPVTQTLNEF